MTNEEILGNGTSRSMRCPSNILEIYPTWPDAARAMAAGTFQYDIGPKNPAGIKTKGTDLIAENLLSDETGQSMVDEGFSDTAPETPDDAYKVLISAVSQLTDAFLQNLEDQCVILEAINMMNRAIEMRYQYDTYLGENELNPILQFIYKDDASDLPDPNEKFWILSNKWRREHPELRGKSPLFPESAEVYPTDDDERIGPIGSDVDRHPRWEDMTYKAIATKAAEVVADVKEFLEGFEDK